MQQPTLAPAPHGHMSPQDTTEQTLRAHLLPHINTPQGGAPGSGASTDGKTTSSSPDLNIDPAISGVGAGASATQAPQPQHQQPQQQQPPQQQPNAHAPPAQQQQPPPQTQQLQQQPQPQAQTPQQQHQQQVHTPGVQSIQMSVSPVLSQGVPADHSQPQSGSEDAGGDNTPKARGGKRELSTSKRAAQNRAAQRAFRQRKEGYIKKLEEQVRDFTAMQESYKQISAENYQLRAYIISLQSRVIDAQGADALPPPPVSLNLSHPPPTMFSLDPSISGEPQAVAAPGQPSPRPVQQQAGQQNISAPTANMGGQPTTMPPQQTIPTAAATGQKRPHEENANTDGAFLQSIAQAAGTTTAPNNGFIAAQPPRQTQPHIASGQPPPQKTTRKSASPTAKRVKGEPQPQAEKA